MEKPGSRFGAADWLKAAAIIAVVVTHSGPEFFDPRYTKVDELLRQKMAGFHVPIFLMVSGYLGWSASPLAPSHILRRIGRVFAAYSVATIAMTALGYASWADLGWHLLMGTANGIYYFVPVWIFCVLTSWVWSRTSRNQLLWSLIIVIVLSGARYFFVSNVPWNWALRDPFGQGWLFCFLFGWCARARRWDEWALEHKEWSVLVFVAAALALCTPLYPPASPWNSIMKLSSRMTYSVAIAWLATCWLRPAPPKAVRELATITFPLFLYHQPVAQALREHLYGMEPIARIILTAAGAAGISSTVILVLRRLLPTSARRYLLAS